MAAVGRSDGAIGQQVDVGREDRALSASPQAVSVAALALQVLQKPTTPQDDDRTARRTCRTTPLTPPPHPNHPTRPATLSAWDAIVERDPLAPLLPGLHVILRLIHAEYKQIAVGLHKDPELKGLKFKITTRSGNKEEVSVRELIDRNLVNLQVAIAPLLVAVDRNGTHDTWEKPPYHKEDLTFLNWEATREAFVTLCKFVFQQQEIFRGAAAKGGKSPLLGGVERIFFTLPTLIQSIAFECPSRLWTPLSAPLDPPTLFASLPAALKELHGILGDFPKRLTVPACVLPDETQRLLRGPLNVTINSYKRVFESLEQGAEEPRLPPLDRAIHWYQRVKNLLIYLEFHRMTSLIGTGIFAYSKALEERMDQVPPKEKARLQRHLQLCIHLELLLASLAHSIHKVCCAVFVEHVRQQTLINTLHDAEQLFSLLGGHTFTSTIQSKLDLLHQELEQRADPNDPLWERWRQKCQALENSRTTIFGNYIPPVQQCRLLLEAGTAKPGQCSEILHHVFTVSRNLLIWTGVMTKTDQQNPVTCGPPLLIEIEDDLRRWAEFQATAIRILTARVEAVISTDLTDAHKLSVSSQMQADAALIRDFSSKQPPPIHSAKKKVKGGKPKKGAEVKPAKPLRSVWSEAVVPDLPVADTLSYHPVEAPVSSSDRMRLLTLSQRLPLNPFTKNFRLLAGQFDEIRIAPLPTIDAIHETTDLLRRLFESLFHHLLDTAGVPIPETHNLITLAQLIFKSGVSGPIQSMIVERWKVISLLATANGSVNYPYSCELPRHPDATALHSYLLKMTREPDWKQHESFIVQAEQGLVQLLLGLVEGATGATSIPADLLEPLQECEHPLFARSGAAIEESVVDLGEAASQATPPLSPRRIRDREGAKEAVREALIWIQLLQISPIEGATDQQLRHTLRNHALENVEVALIRLADKFNHPHYLTQLCHSTLGVLRLLRRAIKEGLVGTLLNLELYDDQGAHVTRSIRHENNPLRLYQHLPAPQFSPPPDHLGMLHLATHYPYPHPTHRRRPPEIDHLLSQITEQVEMREQLRELGPDFKQQIGKRSVGQEDLDSGIAATIERVEQSTVFPLLEYLLELLAKGFSN